MPTRDDLVGAAILVAVFLAVLVAAEAWRRWGRPRPESTRKLVHLGGGLTCLFFPLLVTSPWVVLVLTAAMSGLFAGAARLGFLKSLHGVDRSSRGAEYYPLAIFLVFLLSGDRTWIYVAAVLVLATADAFAALIGSRYGKIRYQTENDEKSLEGSLVFLVISFLAIHLPVLLLTDLPRVTSVLAALLVAMLVTGFEAISLRGSDNLFVPVGVVFVLGKITTKPVPEIVFQNLSLIAICLIVAALTRWVPVFNTGAAVAVILYTFANWSLGSWQWALPVFTGVAFYLAGWFWIAKRAPEGRVRVRAVSRALVPLLLVLVAANMTHSFTRLYGPYVAATAAVLSFSLAGPVLDLKRLSGWSRPAVAAPLALVTTVITGALPWLVQGGVSPYHLPVCAAVVFLATWMVIVFDARPGAPVGWVWTASRLLMTWAVAGVILLLQVTGVIRAWSPG
jgi:phytol kinase